jgi:hypothetical protein
MYQFTMEQIQDVMTKSNGREAAKDIRLDQDKQHLEEREQDYDGERKLSSENKVPSWNLR